MKRTALAFSLILALLFSAVAGTILALNVNWLTWSHTSPTEDTSKNLYQSFLTDVMGVDLTKYTITQSGYGVSYPSKWGGLVKEEALSYILDSEQGKVDTFCTIDDGIVTVCKLYSSTQGGSIIYTQPPATSTLDAAKNFLQKYQIFTNQFSPQDTSHLMQAISSLDGVDAQTLTEKIVGNMKLTISPSPTLTSIHWTYVQGSLEVTNKIINLHIVNNSINFFADNWNRYPVSNQSIISEDEAESFAFAEIQNFKVNQIQPDWTNMTYEASLGWATGAATKTSLDTFHTTYPSNVTRDPLTLYPMWHFIFYFGKPVGHTIGLEVLVWADTKELAECNEYGYLGGSLPTPTPQ